MYSPSELYTAIRKPRIAAREINKLYHTAAGQHDQNPDGTNILDEDWDNLILLDACRYDYFADHVDIEADMQQRQSLGASTPEFIQTTFTDCTAHDIVYISANSWYQKLSTDINAELHRFINLQSGNYAVEWAVKDLRVVDPSSVTKLAKRYSDEYPSKRLIVHYLQPHHPFVGDFGMDTFNYQSTSLYEVFEKSNSESRDDLRRAYAENLDIVLDEVSRLLPELDGKTVITADHGEMLGERHSFIPVRDYGHHQGIYNQQTVDVPWMTINSGERKSIEAEQPVKEKDDVHEEVINDTLRSLGYKI